MGLKEYLKDKGIKQATLAKSIGISRSYVSLICSGKRKPGADMAIAIQTFTKKDVTIEELRK